MGASHKKPLENDSNLETYSLIWLDSSFHNSEENFKIQQRLRIVINHLKIFQNSNQCEEYIRSIGLENRLILIINDRFTRQIIPRIEQLRQVSSIYIHCLNKKINNQQWAKQFLKVKCLSDELDILIRRIQSDHKIDDLFSIIIYKSNELNFHFIYSHLLFDCLLRMNSNNKNEFISLCKNQYKYNEYELNNIYEFEKNYSVNQALLWYTKKSFIYRILTKALRIQNINLLFILRFFIQDIYQQVERYKCLCPIRVYHCHLMTYEEIKLFQNSIGQFISINSFLLANLDRGLELFYLYELNDLERVLFEINTDSKIFEYIQFKNYFQENEQIIFMLGTIFQLENIFINNDGIWIIQMKLCTENNFQLKTIFHVLKNEYYYKQEKIFFSFGQFLIQQGHLNDAEKYYLRLLNEIFYQTKDIIQCYDTLGQLAKDKYDYELSIQWFNKSIILKTQDDLSLIENYNNIGEIYQIKSDYKQAIESYNKALIIFIKIFGEDHPKLAICFNNLAIAYKREKKYIQALEYHQKALMILEKHQPINHSYLAISHNNIGVIYRHCRRYNLALKHYQYALEIYKKSFSSSYLEIAKTFRNIGIVYENKGDLQQSLLYFKNAATIYRHTLSSIHPDVIEIEEKIQFVSSHLK